MAEEQRKTWRELCRAALDAKDPDELLQIAQELTKVKVLKREEQIRHDFRVALSATSLPGKFEVSNVPDELSRYLLSHGRLWCQQLHRTPCDGPVHGCVIRQEASWSKFSFC
jgi:hypothetical protein